MPPPTPPADVAGDDLVDTADRLRLGVTRLARLLRRQSDTDLTPTQLSALATIGRCGPLPVGALADAEGVTAPTATKVVDKLERGGLVERTAHPVDGRVSLVSRTPLAESVLAEIRERRTAWLTTRLGDLAADELAVLTSALPVLEHLVAGGAAEDRAADAATVGS